MSLSIVDIQRASVLARFRANPNKVRVSIRRESEKNTWLVCIRIDGHLVLAYRHTNPEEGIWGALLEAKNLEGIDLCMAWAFEHPWGAQGVKARLPRKDDDE